MSYTGTVKSYNAASGWGFVACDETYAIHNKDIIILKKNKGEVIIHVGDEVTFNISDGQKGPEAVELTILSQGNFPEVMPEERKKGWFVGNVKSYIPSKGWGFVCSPDSHKIHGKDIFLMRAKDKGVPVDAGDRVRFTIKKGEKGPEVDKLEMLSEKGEKIKTERPARSNQEKPSKGKGKSGSSNVISKIGKPAYKGSGKDAFGGKGKGMEAMFGEFMQMMTTAMSYGKGKGGYGSYPSW